MRTVVAGFAKIIALCSVLLGVNMRIRELHSCGNMIALQELLMERGKGESLCESIYDLVKMMRDGLIGMNMSLTLNELVQVQIPA